MVARTPERIVQDMSERRGRGAKLRAKLEKNRDRNWLLALTTHSFGKFAEKQRLSDLEKTLVSAFLDNGYTEEELRTLGEASELMPQNVRQDVYPGRFARLDVKSSYSFEDLRKDAPEIVRATMAMPNLTVVDADEAHKAKVSAKELPRLNKRAVAEYGAEFLMVQAPSVSAAAAPSGFFTIKATEFRCNDETGADFWGSDESYWIFATLAEGTTVTTKSRTFGDVDSGDRRTFSAADGNIWGPNGGAQRFPEGQIGTMIQLWEHDHGDPEKIRKGVAAAFAAAAGVLAASGVAAWIGAVVAGVGAVVHELLAFLDDDLIGEQTFVFHTTTLAKQVRNVGDTQTMTRRFTDGDGDYTLTIVTTRTGN
ncbi:hypothetical protein [Nocardiopsis chromatogenes]|uniref:hypothetical protein n=1 Tax=Nocardiopsis chromatogenes TaxID=280239 RepID=UPI00034A2F7F|nr:hypothetical protein [Nocardiopsis chromatogenes]